MLCPMCQLNLRGCGRHECGCFSVKHRTSLVAISPLMSRVVARTFLQGAQAACAAGPLSDGVVQSSGLMRQLHARLLSSIGTSSSTSGDWSEHVVEQFAVQPSYFSPLYPTYKQLADKDVRRQLAAKLLQAHNELAREVEGYDTAQITAEARHRVQEMQRMADELRLLSQRANLAACSARGLALGYYSLLEEESLRGDADAEGFHATIHSQSGNIWEHWQKHFVAPYVRAPGLDPLHVVYSRQAGGLAGEEAADVQQASNGESADSTSNPLMKVTLSDAGVASAVGRRKSSIAQVSMARGEGRVFINNLPFDDAIRDPGLRLHVLQPFFVTNTMGQFDVVAHVRFGGLSSQAQAIQQGIAQALTALVGNRLVLKGMVLRDSRKVERKKPGRVKARKGFAYVRR